MQIQSMTVEEQELSDGSFVYNVTGRDGAKHWITIQAIDQKHAEEIAYAINEGANGFAIECL